MPYRMAGEGPNYDHYIMKSQSVNGKEIALIFDTRTEDCSVIIDVTRRSMNVLSADITIHWNGMNLDEAIAEFESQVRSECLHPSSKLETVITYGRNETLVGSRCTVCGEMSILSPEEIMTMGR